MASVIVSTYGSFLSLPIYFFLSTFFPKNKKIVLLVFNNLADSKRKLKLIYLTIHMLVLTKLYIMKKPTQLSLYLCIKVKKFQGEVNII